MIDRQHDLSIRQQVRLLNISRGCVYYQPRETSTADLTIMRRMDELHLDHPFAGSRMLRDMLRREGHNIGRRHVRSLMRKMGLQTLYRKPNLSNPATGRRIYPYLLRGLVIDRPNQVWATDITYIPMAKGFVYLCAIIDWYSRSVLSHRVSISLEVDPCIEALEEAISTHGTPEIFNTNQGSQFTCDRFTNVLKQHGIQISMDGRGRWMDNVIIERLWRTVKYEEVYLKYVCQRTRCQNTVICIFRVLQST